MNHINNLKIEGYTLLKNYLNKKQIDNWKLQKDLVTEVVGDTNSGVPVGL
jgi:hypothetical protein